MMTLSDLLSRITQIAFVGLGILSLLDYLRYRGRVRRDIALMFASLAGAIGIGIINGLLAKPIVLFSLAASLAIIAQPYLLVRLVGYFRPIPRFIRVGAVVGMIVSWFILVIVGSALPPLLTLVVVLYFVIVDGYAMVAFVQGALVTSGVVQRRLRFAAAGSGLLALALLWAGLAIVLPGLKTVGASLTQLSAIGSALCFYLGLAAPHWLRQTWELSELRQFLLQMTRDSPPETAAEVYKVLCHGTLKLTGAREAKIVLRQNETKRWLLHSLEATGSAHSIETTTVLETCWQNRSTAAIAVNTLNPVLRNALQPGTVELMYIVPLVRDRRGWGLVLVFLEHGSLFVDDDLQIISLFAEQSAIVLENIELIEHLRQYTDSLEERTAHLTAVNRELEAFSYSVSHDLRAPLRAVDGFSQALLEDYDDALDDVGRDFLHRIRAESQRMGQLIDDLIGLSRFSRTEMTLKMVDLSEIVREITADFEAKEPDRAVELSIQQGIKACGDERLIRVALQNLVGNAWKFTMKKPKAQIEFGCKHGPDVTEYYVRDNGAGFDMAYANKLFGAFQRLHAMDEFTGTGIGLATVQRIMHRHGGSIRAEGVVNEGATFYFTLGSKNCS